MRISDWSSDVCSSDLLACDARGFSFQKDGPLDMRMAQEGESAADWLNRADEDEIADVLYHYGDERQSRRVARAIVAARPQIGRAACRERVCQYVLHSVGAVYLNKKKTQKKKCT